MNRRRPSKLQRFLLHTNEQNINKDTSQSYEEFSEAVSETEKALMRISKGSLLGVKEEVSQFYLVDLFKNI